MIDEGRPSGYTEGELEIASVLASELFHQPELPSGCAHGPTDRTDDWVWSSELTLFSLGPIVRNIGRAVALSPTKLMVALSHQGIWPAAKKGEWPMCWLAFVGEDIWFMPLNVGSFHGEQPRKRLTDRPK